jgi:putative DNA primase/helicase
MAAAAEMNGEGELGDELDRRGKLADVGGRSYLMDMAAAGMARADVSNHIIEILEHARRREEAAIIGRLTKLSNNPMSGPAGALEAEAAKLLELRKGAESSHGLRAPEFEQTWVAERLVERSGDDLIFVPHWGQWYSWSGKHWQREFEAGMTERLREICVSAAATADKSEARRLNTQTMVQGAEFFARGMQSMSDCGQFDADPLILNTPTGTVCLQTGELREHNKSDLCTRITAVGPGDANDCPRWMKFLDVITKRDVELQAYLQRVAGYSLLGSNPEQCFFFLHGQGANGKGVFISTLAGILQDYSTTMLFETLASSNSDQHPTDLASIRAARLVTVNETADGRSWDESKLKAITGGEPMKARFMRQDGFTFIPVCKLIISGNHRPSLRSVDEAFKRRVNLLPFNAWIEPDKRDPDLADTLRRLEWPGILAWMVKGCLEYRKMRLKRPAAVEAATKDYMQEQDQIGRYIAERCVKEPNYKAQSSTLFADYRDWCEANGDRYRSQKMFSQGLESHGHEVKHTMHGNMVLGIQLKP